MKACYKRSSTYTIVISILSSCLLVYLFVLGIKLRMFAAMPFELEHTPSCKYH